MIHLTCIPTASYLHTCLLLTHLHQARAAADKAQQEAQLAARRTTTAEVQLSLMQVRGSGGLMPGQHGSRTRLDCAYLQG